MRKRIWLMIVLLFVLITLLSACGSDEEQMLDCTEAQLESDIETTEPEVEFDPQWISGAAIDEAYACLFPTEGEKNVALAQEILLPLVESGNAEAQYYWGYIYDWEFSDDNVEYEQESLYWYELAVDQGFPKAYLAAALNTYVESEERANELIDLAKQAGLFEMTQEELRADGCLFLARVYEKNMDYHKALEWFTKAADGGSSVAKYFIGNMYYRGNGVKQDIAVSLDWHLQAANQGCVPSMSQYAWIVLTENFEDNLVEQMYASNLETYRKRSEDGDPIAMYNLGHMYEIGCGEFSVNYNAALDWYTKAANLGDSSAMYRIGVMYQYGYLARDYKTAMDWYMKAAELGNSDAMFMIGSMYSQGLGVDPDIEKAKAWNKKAEELQQHKERNDAHIDSGRDWYAQRKYTMDILQSAAAAGYAPAMSNLGYWGYDQGYLRNDEASARIWYEKASAKGNSVAMFNEGMLCYSAGNYDSAMECFIKAYANGERKLAYEYINKMLNKKQGVTTYFKHYGELISARP